MRGIESRTAFLGKVPSNFAPPPLPSPQVDGHGGGSEGRTK